MKDRDKGNTVTRKQLKAISATLKKLSLLRGQPFEH